ncbi:MAG TPA: 5-deoxy-glucuronate isomerase, partial [Chthoniobacterales bacterium]
MESKLHIRPTSPDRSGRILHLTPEIAGWKYVGFDLYNLQPSEGISGINVDREICAVIITGTATLRANDTLLANTRHRISPFHRETWALYVPVGANWEITAVTSLEVAVCSAPATNAKEPRLIRPDEVIQQERG